MGYYRSPMDVLVYVAVTAGVALVLALLCRCCCSSRYKGRVLQPPPEPGTAPAPYPQQQYTVTVPAVTAIPVGHNVTAAPYPAHYPVAAPYPAAAPYPTGAPYPAVAPYPGGPGGMPHPHLPTAPDVNAFVGVAPPGWQAHALPPTYEQVMSASKQPPYNPHPH